MRSHHGNEIEVGYVLILGNHRVILWRPMVLGRGPAADVVLTDITVSRRHARIVSNGRSVFISDLGSANGTRVNGVLIDGERELESADVIGLGESELTLLCAADVPPSAQAGFEMELPRSSSGAGFDTLPGGTFDILAMSAQDALESGDGERAELLVGRRLLQLLPQVRAGDATEQQIDLAVRLTFGLARVRRDPKWIDHLVQLHESAGRPMTKEIIDALYELTRTVRGINPKVLERYCERFEHPQTRADRDTQLGTKRVCALLPLIRF